MQSSHEVYIVDRFYYDMKEPAQNAIPHVDPLQLGSVTKEQGGIGKIKKKQSEKLQRDAHISNKKLPNRDSG